MKDARSQACCREVSGHECSQPIKLANPSVSYLSCLVQDFYPVDESSHFSSRIRPVVMVTALFIWHGQTASTWALTWLCHQVSMWGLCMISSFPTKNYEMLTRTILRHGYPSMGTRAHPNTVAGKVQNCRKYRILKVVVGVLTYQFCSSRCLSYFASV